MNIAQFHRKNYVVINDYFSRCLEVDEIKGKITSDVIIKFKKIFSRFDIPKHIITDNNPFNSLEFINFCKQWDIKLSTFNPYYHQSNSLAEKSVNIVKGMLKKISEEGGDLNLYLLNYRNTPVTGLRYSHAQLLQNWRLRFSINNFKEECLKLIVVNASEEIIINKEKQIRNYNKMQERKIKNITRVKKFTYKM